MDELNIAKSGWSWHVGSTDECPATASFNAGLINKAISESLAAPDVTFSWIADRSPVSVHCLEGLNLRALALSINFAPNVPRVQSYSFRVIDPPVLKERPKPTKAVTKKPDLKAIPHSEEFLEALPQSTEILTEDLSSTEIQNTSIQDTSLQITGQQCSTAEDQSAGNLDDANVILSLPNNTFDAVVTDADAALQQTNLSGELDSQNSVIEEEVRSEEDQFLAEMLESFSDSSMAIQKYASGTPESIDSTDDELDASLDSPSCAISESATNTDVATNVVSEASGSASEKPPEHTWVKPPADVVKLEDRLFYMLQPSLETLITEGDLHFPFHPFNYQFHGVAFLYPRVSAVLADEMGLGKTMQAITSIRLLIHACEVRSVLLVCPKPLVSNWVREFQQWAPEIPVAVIEGDTAKREWQWNQVDAPVKIANYEALIRDRDLATQPDRHFDLIVLDESQRIKNRNGTTAQVIRSLNRTRSWALTGTPVENSSDDLLGIFEFVAPGHLHKGMKPRAIGKAAADFILRRTKDQVLTDMPPKMYHDAHVELTAEQNETYQLAENDGILRLSGMGASATIQHVFELVLRLKQICNFDPATGESSKLERLEADMEEIAASGKKAILFSQWVEPLTKIKERLERFGILEYHGKIPHKQREGVIQQFKSDPDKHLILMSYGAGSVGLNLQFCEYVFLFDRWWNPAVEDQAINRAHRIGAVGPVTVTRFLTMNTIEERINQVLEEKRELFDTILGGATSHRSLGLNAEEIFGLFKLKSPNGPIRFAA